MAQLGLDYVAVLACPPLCAGAGLTFLRLLRGLRTPVRIAATGIFLMAACSPAPEASTPAPTGQPSVEAQASPSPSPPAQTSAPESPPAAPAQTSAPESPPAAVGQSSVAVVFTSLPPGVYPVHLHSVCSGNQAFHITVLQSLSVGSEGTGSIPVPASDSGRGWCVIVYGNQSLSRVLTTRTI